MTGKPSEHSTFEVTSGSICYGELHNVWHGTSVATQPFPAHVTEDEDGTVRSHELFYNTVAENGTWKAYQLKDKLTGLVSGWFACHSSVEPEAEVDRILCVSGSPYEPDSGSDVNDETTFAEAVLVINRYDWGSYDGRSKNVAPAVNDELDIPELHAGIGLVDGEAAKEAVQTWSRTGSDSRETVPGGVWMHVPGGEYQFGRFGFDPDRKAALSFLFFTTNTLFGRTSFDGLSQPLREPVDGNGGEEVRESTGWTKPPHDSGDGILKLKAQIANPDSLWFTLPADDEYLGPYGGVDQEEGVLTNAEIETIRTQHGVERQFQAKRSEKAYRCINEAVMTFLERQIVPTTTSAQNVKAAALSLFPNHEQDPSFDKHMYGLMLKPDSSLKDFPAETLDRQQIGDRIQRFLSTRSSSSSSSSSSSRAKSLTQDQSFINGIVACVIFLVAVVLEQSEQAARDCSRKKIFPIDIRMGILLDQDLLGMFKYSRYYWNGDGDQAQS